MGDIEESLKKAEEHMRIARIKKGEQESIEDSSPGYTSGWFEALYEQGLALYEQNRIIINNFLNKKY